MWPASSTCLPFLPSGMTGSEKDTCVQAACRLPSCAPAESDKRRNNLSQEDKISHLVPLNASLVNEITVLRAFQRELTEKIIKREELLHKSQSEINNLHKENKGLLLRLRVLRDDLVCVKRENDDLRAGNAASCCRVKELETLEREMGFLLEEQKRAKAMVEDQNEKLCLKIEELEDNIACCIAEGDRVKHENANLVIELSKVLSNAKEMKAERDMATAPSDEVDKDFHLLVSAHKKPATSVQLEQSKHSHTSEGAQITEETNWLFKDEEGRMAKVAELSNCMPRLSKQFEDPSMILNDESEVPEECQRAVFDARKHVVTLKDEMWNLHILSSKLAEEILAVTNENKLLSMQIGILFMEKEQLLVPKGELEGTMSSLLQKHEEFEGCFPSLLIIRKELNEGLNQSQNCINGLQREKKISQEHIGALLIEKSHLEDSLHANRTELFDALEAMERMTKESKELRMQTSSLIAGNGCLLVQKRELEGIKLSLLWKPEVLEDKVSLLTKMQEELNGRLCLKQRAWTEAAEKHTAAILWNMSQLETSLCAVMSNNQELSEQVDAKDHALSPLSPKKIELDLYTEELSQDERIISLEGEKEKLYLHDQVLEDEIACLKEEICCLNLDKNMLLFEKMMLFREKEMEGTLSVMGIAHQNVVKRLDAMTTELDQLQAENERLSSEASSLKGDSSLISNMGITLLLDKQVVSTLKIELEGALYDLGESCKAIDEQLQADRKKKAAIYDNLMSEIERLHMERLNLTVKSVSSSSSLAACEEEIQCILSKGKFIETEIACLKEVLRDLESDNFLENEKEANAFLQSILEDEKEANSFLQSILEAKNIALGPAEVRLKETCEQIAILDDELVVMHSQLNDLEAELTRKEAIVCAGSGALEAEEAKNVALSEFELWMKEACEQIVRLGYEFAVLSSQLIDLTVELKRKEKHVCAGRADLQRAKEAKDVTLSKSEQGLKEACERIASLEDDTAVNHLCLSDLEAELKRRKELGSTNCSVLESEEQANAVLSEANAGVESSLRLAFESVKNDLAVADKIIETSKVDLSSAQKSSDKEAKTVVTFDKNLQKTLKRIGEASNHAEGLETELVATKKMHMEMGSQVNAMKADLPNSTQVDTMKVDLPNSKMSAEEETERAAILEEKLKEAQKKVQQFDMETQMNVMKDELLKAPCEALKYKQQYEEVLCKAQALQRELKTLSKKEKLVESQVEMMNGRLTTVSAEELPCSTRDLIMGRKKINHEKGKASGEAPDHADVQNTQNLNAIPKIRKKFYENLRLALPIVVISASTLLYVGIQSLPRRGRELAKLRSEYGRVFKVFAWRNSYS